MTGGLPSWWTSAFPDAPPLGHRLRLAYPDRWLRIHSLPESRRYPSDAAELELLLDRHQAVADELLGRERACMLVTPTWTPAELGERRTLAACFDAREFECVAVEAEPDPDDPVGRWTCFWALETTWDPARDRAIVAEVADDQLRAVWLSFDGPHGPEVYAPYDGGADLILADPARRGALASRWAAWLSRRPDGM